MCPLADGGAAAYCASHAAWTGAMSGGGASGAVGGASCRAWHPNNTQPSSMCFFLSLRGLEQCCKVHALQHPLLHHSMYTISDLPLNNV